MSSLNSAPPSHKTEVAPVAGYPVFDSTTEPSAATPHDLLAHYEAGYLVVTGPDDAGFRELLELPPDPELSVDLPAPQESSLESLPNYEPEPAETAGERGPQGVPTPTLPGAAVVRKLYAKLPDGQLAHQKLLVASADAVSAQVERWRGSLGGGGVLLADGAPTANSSDVNPDPTAWTRLGTSTVSIDAQGWFSPWYFNTDWKYWPTGSAAATISLFRLNSIDAFDFFLIKVMWTVSPRHQRHDLGGFWFNNHDHQLQLGLTAQTARGDVQGDLINFEPKTIPSSQTYDIKFGGDLSAKVGANAKAGKEREAGASGEVGGSVSAEIATSVTFPSVSVSAARSGPAQVRWDLNHYVDTIFDRQWTLTWPDTTVSGMTATTWALYSFRRDINDGAPPQMRVDIRLTGNFASIVNKFWPGGQALTLPYESSWQTLPFPVPVLRTEQPYTPENPIRIAPGQTVKVKIIASSPQLLLSWKPYEIPTDQEGRQYLAVTPTSSFLGDGELQITALEFATPSFAYLRLNSVPPGAADSLRQGGLDLPIKIVDRA